MFKKFYTSFFVIALLCIVSSLPVYFFINRNSAHQKTTHRKLQILCTTSMITDAVKQIGGDTINVHGLMGPGIDPHLYKAREGDVHRLIQADIIFFNGLHLEGRIAHILEQMNKYTKSISVAQALKKTQLISADIEGIYDPHIWHDVTLWMQIVELISKTLIAQDITHQKTYEKNTADYLEKLRQLDEYVKNKIAYIPEKQRILVTAHDAFSYFGKAYGMRVVGLQGVSTDCEIGTRDIQNLVDFLVGHQIRAIFVESSIPMRSIQAVQHAATARGWQMILGDELFSDALGDKQSDADTYIGMIKHNIDTIAVGLSSRQTDV